MTPTNVYRDGPHVKFLLNGYEYRTDSILYCIEAHDLGRWHLTYSAAVREAARAALAEAKTLV